jgi:proline racemase
MRADHVFKVIDVHAGGAPSRLVLSGIPPLIGQTPMDKMRYFEAHNDWIRRSLVLEPRGGSLTSAVVVMPPSRPDAHVDAFFVEPHGYLPMCGSDTIATVTALIETGQVPPTGAHSVVCLNTPAGLVEARAHRRRPGRRSHLRRRPGILRAVRTVCGRPRFRAGDR